jgi:hypothetical protein
MMPMIDALTKPCVFIKPPGMIKRLCSFSFTKKKTTQRNRPCGAALRVALCFSNRAVAVELAGAQTATAPIRPLL